MSMQGLQHGGLFMNTGVHLLVVGEMDFCNRIKCGCLRGPNHLCKTVHKFSLHLHTVDSGQNHNVEKRKERKKGIARGNNRRRSSF